MLHRGDSLWYATDVLVSTVAVVVAVYLVGTEMGVLPMHGPVAHGVRRAVAGTGGVPEVLLSPLVLEVCVSLLVVHGLVGLLSGILRAGLAMAAGIGLGRSGETECANGQGDEDQSSHNASCVWVAIFKLRQGLCRL
jgi:hypothetical protein